ncbi:hypothetical protein [Luteimonas notoginsengisoli]|uniref:Uncharacterized protein n=1 Tax=Luteimonas notoginsengisoli TaxID=1578200 RepID=A0ABV7URZ5_9GAMM
MEILLNERRDAISVSIDGPLSANAVESLIEQLMQARMDMTPEVPRTYAQARDADAKVMDLGEPHVVFVTERGGLRLLIRGAGCGWLTLLYPTAGFGSLRQLLGEQLPERGAAH